MMFNIYICLLLVINIYAQAPCTLPENHVMNLYSIEGGVDTYTDIKTDVLTFSNNEKTYEGSCFKILKTPIPYKNSISDILVIYITPSKDQYFCYRMLWRSQYIMQYAHTSIEGNNKTVCQSVQNSNLFFTGFVKTRDKKVDFNCKSIIEGVYQFDYRVHEYTGICNNPNNIIKACQRQGSPLRDNSVFTMKFAFCPTINPTKSGGNIKYMPYDFVWRCYGRWIEADDSIWGGIEFDAFEEPFKYRCIKTRIDQLDATMQTWGITTNAECQKLNEDLSKAPLKIQARPAFDPDVTLNDISPGCKLPINFTGNWFYPSEYSTEVTINSTHIYYKRKMEQNRYEEIYFVCREFQENRYLMATVTKGKCYLDYTCFHFLPRHHNIIRFRMGKPFREDQDSKERESDHMTRIFREACHWNSFTLNYVDWVYEYFILDPPVPINCPIQGRYKFVQKAQEEEKYITKIPGGMTPRPRVQVLCDGKMEPDLNSCYENPKQLNLDVERCMRLDFNGRPISEYDVTDNRLTCVGYWMEDTKSFLITYDPEDPVTHNFRCWVYKRVDLNNYLMSRSQGTHCRADQNPESTGPETGASLQLELQQNELEFDACPMSFDDGHDPYANPSMFKIFSAAPSRSTWQSYWMIFLALLLSSILYR